MRNESWVMMSEVFSPNIEFSILVLNICCIESLRKFVSQGRHWWSVEQFFVQYFLKATFNFQKDQFAELMLLAGLASVIAQVHKRQPILSFFSMFGHTFTWLKGRRPFSTFYIYVRRTTSLHSKAKVKTWVSGSILLPLLYMDEPFRHYWWSHYWYRIHIFVVVSMCILWLYV